MWLIFMSSGKDEGLKISLCMWAQLTCMQEREREMVGGGGGGGGGGSVCCRDLEIVYMEKSNWIDLDCSRKLSIVLNVSLLTLRHA